MFQQDTSHVEAALQSLTHTYGDKPITSPEWSCDCCWDSPWLPEDHSLSGKRSERSPSHLFKLLQTHHQDAQRTRGLWKCSSQKYIKRRWRSLIKPPLLKSWRAAGKFTRTTKTNQGPLKSSQHQSVFWMGSSRQLLPSVRSTGVPYLTHHFSISTVSKLVPG